MLSQPLYRIDQTTRPLNQRSYKSVSFLFEVHSWHDRLRFLDNQAHLECLDMQMFLSVFGFSDMAAVRVHHPFVVLRTNNLHFKEPLIQWSCGYRIYSLGDMCLGWATKLARLIVPSRKKSVLSR